MTKLICSRPIIVKRGSSCRPIILGEYPTLGYKSSMAVILTENNCIFNCKYDAEWNYGSNGSYIREDKISGTPDYIRFKLPTSTKCPHTIYYALSMEPANDAIISHIDVDISYLENLEQPSI